MFSDRADFYSDKYSDHYIIHHPNDYKNLCEKYNDFTKYLHFQELINESNK